ncbi:MAG: Holliday junction branch migration protein RuvA [Succinivibrio sp.]|nr:Holliday junction branch migration protein RuvA [Succinivibrio sp.]
MIGSLRGSVLRVDGSVVLLEVQGLGYEVEMPFGQAQNLLPLVQDHAAVSAGAQSEVAQAPKTQNSVQQSPVPAVKPQAFVYIHHSISENGQALYGFKDYPDRALFRELIKISGVGPKLALAVLSTYEAPAFIQTVLSGESAALQRIPGVGKRMAERLMVELKDRVKKLQDSTTSDTVTPAQGGTEVASFAEAVSALTGLGYREADSIKAVKATAQPQMDTATLLRAALQYISQQKRS